MTEAPTSHADARTRKSPRRLAVAGAAAVAVVAAAVIGFLTLAPAPSQAKPALSAPAGALPTALPGYRALDAAGVAALPEARYDAVIPGLIPVSSKDLGTQFRTATLTGSAPLFGAGAAHAVARLNPIDFTGAPTAILIARTTGEWSLILTPARTQQPSQTGGHAAAQTAAWVPTQYLTGIAPATTQITVDTAALTLTITQQGGAPQSFPMAAGKETTPTPTGVTGYLQARYVDASQGTGSTPIQLTSLHSAVDDNPAGGISGGLIAIHYFPTNTGKVSHGCIRVTQQAIAAINKLPAATPILIR